MMEELAIIQTDVLLILQSLSDLVDQSFGIFPSQTWVGDGFAVAVFSDLLAAWFDIAFYHDTFDHLVDLWRTSLTIRICSMYCLPELEWLASTMQAGFARSRLA